MEGKNKAFEEYVRVSKNIKIARAKVELSNMDMSKILGISLNEYISKENSPCLFTLNELVAIINTVGGSIEELINA
jgi:DNA-binding XRE family transcriptional regulator